MSYLYPHHTCICIARMRSRLIDFMQLHKSVVHTSYVLTKHRYHKLWVYKCVQNALESKHVIFKYFREDDMLICRVQLCDPPHHLCCLTDAYGCIITVLLQSLQYYIINCHFHVYSILQSCIVQNSFSTKPAAPSNAVPSNHGTVNMLVSYLCSTTTCMQCVHIWYITACGYFLGMHMWRGQYDHDTVDKYKPACNVM